jgi:chromosome segregation and condensation protein ScpB/DNA-binding XRE family transcriptional regulator
VGRTAVPKEQRERAGDELAGLAAELRRRRELLRLSQVALATLSGVSRTVINRVESGARVPSVRTYARLRAALGLEAPPAALIPTRLPVVLGEDLVTALCAALVVTRDVSLADLASALDISIPAVRENLDRAAQRLEGIGFSLTDDGGRVRPFAMPCAEGAVRTLSDVEEVVTPSAEQLEILAIVAYFAQATRSLIEHYRGEDSESLLQRLVRRGLLAKVRDDQVLGAPNVYRVTAKALRATGFPTVEAMRSAVVEVVSAEERMRLLAHGDAALGSDALPAERVAS